MTTVTGGPSTLSAETRSPGAVRTNRTLLALVGLLLLLIGLATLALGTGLLNPPAQDQPVLNTTADTWLEGHSWIWWPIAAAGVLIALLCLRWLLAQARSNRVSSLRIGERTPEGHTTVAGSALTAALENEVEGYRGVQRTHAHLTGSPSAPRLSLTVTLDGRVPVKEVQQQITDQAIAHARQALSVQTLPTRLEMSLPRSSTRDIR
jgi:hypothetical protein